MPRKYTERVLNLELGSSTEKKYLGKTSPKGNNIYVEVVRS